jgi:hypothetical protein
MCVKIRAYLIVCIKMGNPFVGLQVMIKDEKSLLHENVQEAFLLNFVLRRLLSLIVLFRFEWK